MKWRNTFSGPITLKQPWVLVALGCPMMFLTFKWLDVDDWWNRFHQIGIASLLFGLVFLILEKFIQSKYSSIYSWCSGFFLNWFFAVYILSQISRSR